MNLSIIRRFTLGILLAGILLPLAGLASGLVSTMDETNLRQALLGGGTVLLANDGVIPLTKTIYIANDTTIDADGHNVVLDGQNQVQIFYVASNATLTIKGLTVRNGADGAFYSVFSSFEHTNDLVASGGAVCSFGGLIAVDSRFESNSVTITCFSEYGFSAGLGLAKGGAISSQGGLLALTNCVFFGNSASGNDPAYGGAVSIEGGLATFDHVRFLSNSVSGTCGGAIYASQSAITANSVDLEYNELTGPCGGGVYLDSGSMVFSKSYFGNNRVIGAPSQSQLLSAPGGYANGGAIYSKGALSIVNSTISMNQAIAGYERTGEGGGVYVAAGSASFVCSTLFSNISLSGTFNYSGPNYGGGLNIFISTNSSVSAAGTLIVAPTNTVISIGRFTFSANCSGTISDLGSNLEWPTNDAAPTIPSSDPLLQVPADNGGFVKTAALASNSPAVGANATSCLATDARGVARPSSGCDIGALQTTGSDPQFTAEPTDASVATGANIELAAGVAGTGPFGFQWWFNDSAIAQQMNATLSLTNVAETNGGTYFVVVSNAVGLITSSDAVLQVGDAAPVIRYQPTGTVVTAAGNVSLFVVANGTPPLSYQWQCNGTNIAGATDQWEHLTNFTVNSGDTFGVVVANSSGDVTSDDAALTTVTAPVFITQPTDETYSWYDVSATFTAQCGGTPPLYYQWTFNGTNIEDATTNTLYMHFGQGYQYRWPLPGVYQLQVSNDVGVTLSKSVNLSGPPMMSHTLTISPNNVVPEGTDVTLTSSVYFGSDLQYGWIKDNQSLNGQTTTVLTITNARVSDSGSYQGVAQNQYGTDTGDGTLTVYAPAHITQSPINVRTNVGSTVTFTCSAVGSGPLHYDWFLNGTDLSHHTRTLTVNNVNLNTAGEYTVHVSNDYSWEEATAVLSLIPKAPRITFPPNNYRTTNDTIVMRGAASTAEGTDAVDIRWGTADDDYGYADTTDNFRTWSGNVPLHPGTNILGVATENQWETSRAALVTVFCVRTTHVSVVVSPPNSGQVYSNFHGAAEIGRAYTLTAAPGANYILSNWSGDVSAASRTLSFVVEPEMAIQANFVTNPFPAVAGNYEGLYAENDSVRRDSSGLLLAAVDKSGGISVRVFNAGGVGTSGGTVEVGGHVHLPISRGGKPWLVMDGQLDFVAHRISGTLQGDVWTAEFDCEKALQPLGNTNAFSGRYTYAIGGGDDGASGPLGRSLGTASVSGTGLLNATTYFSDRGIATQSTAVTETGRWPFYATAWNGRGEALGWVTISTVDRSLSGNVTLIRSPIASVLYPAGYTNTTWIAGGSYGATDKTVWPEVNSKTLVFTGGNLTDGFSVVGMSLGGASYRNATNKLSLNFNSSTGVFSGSFVIPTTTKTSTIQAIVVQGLTNVTGFFVGTNRVGLVECQ